MFKAAIACSTVYVSLPFIDNSIKLYYQDTAQNKDLVAHCPTLAKGVFNPTPYMASGLLQSLFGCCRPLPGPPPPSRSVSYQRQLITTGDGGLLSLDWAKDPVDVPPKALLLIVPGLTGGSQSNYIKALVYDAVQRGFRVVVFHGRGVEGTPLKTPKSNHLGYPEDLAIGIQVAMDESPDLPLVGLGTSMGGNLLLKYAGLTGKDCEFKAVTAVCTPFDIVVCSRYLRQRWPSPAYSDRILTENMVKLFKSNLELLQPLSEKGVDFDRALNSRRSYEFDSEVTVKVLGFKNPEQYYRHTSCVQDLHNIEVPTLALNALDDPVVPRQCIPFEEFKSNEHLILVVTRAGGHLGWFTGVRTPKKWYHSVCLEFIEQLLTDSRTQVLN